MLDELVDFVVTALSLALDTSIRCIGDEASHTDALGLLLREGAKVDALHLAFDLVLNSLGGHSGSGCKEAPHTGESVT